MKLKNLLVTLILFLSFISFNIAYAEIAPISKTPSQQASLYDSLITQEVNNKLEKDVLLRRFGVKVNTKNLVVYLDGSVNTDEEAARAIEVSQSTPKVLDINISKLNIKKSMHLLADTYITAKIRGLFIQNDLFGTSPYSITVNVVTNNGVVYLTGTVRTQSQKDKVIAVSKSLNNVREVKAKITIDP